MGPLTAPPRVPWSSVQAKLEREWEPGDHITLIGPTGSGKTHLALILTQMAEYSLIIGTKRKDPLLTQVASSHLITQNLEQDVLWTQDDEPLHGRIMFWPRFPEKASAQARQRAQAVMIRRALDWADRTGGWAVLVDELLWVTKNLKLQGEIDSAYFQGRTQGLSVIGCAQRPFHVPQLALSQASYIFLWQSSDKRDLDRLAEISAGFPRHMIDNAVRQLSWEQHEALFVDTKNKELARVVAPARL